jgi:hypothetical protein
MVDPIETKFGCVFLQAAVESRAWAIACGPYSSADTPIEFRHFPPPWDLTFPDPPHEGTLDE